MASKQASMVPTTDKYPHHDGSLPCSKRNRTQKKRKYAVWLTQWCLNPNETQGKTRTIPNSNGTRIWHFRDVNGIKIELSCLQILSTSIKTINNEKEKARSQNRNVSLYRRKLCKSRCRPCLRLTRSNAICNMTSTTNKPNGGKATNQWPASNTFLELLSTPKERV